MAYCKRQVMTSRRPLTVCATLLARSGLCVLLALALWLPASASNRTVFEVKSAQTQLIDSVYFLNADFEINLPPHIIGAFEQGFDLPLAMEVEVFQHNKYWLDKEIVMIKQNYQIQYHTLLDTVSVLNLNAGSRHYYSNLKEALAALSVLVGFPMLDKHSLTAGKNYSARVRIGIDEAELPVPLKTSGLWDDRWNLVSDWMEWRLNP